MCYLSLLLLICSQPFLHFSLKIAFRELFALPDYFRRENFFNKWGSPRSVKSKVSFFHLTWFACHSTQSLFKSTWELWDFTKSRASHCKYPGICWSPQNNFPENLRALHRNCPVTYKQAHTSADSAFSNPFQEAETKQNLTNLKWCAEILSY